MMTSTTQDHPRLAESPATRLKHIAVMGAVAAEADPLAQHSDLRGVQQSRPTSSSGSGPQAAHSLGQGSAKRIGS